MASRVPWGRVSRRLAAGAALALGLAGAAQAAPALWVIKDADSTIYLFGSMHLLEPGVQWRTPIFDEAYARSTTVWFETDGATLADKSQMTALVQRYGVDPDHPLSGKIAPADLEALKARLAAADVPMAGMERMRPWIAALILTVLPFHKAGFDTKAGADAVVSRAAVQDRKQLRAFATAESDARLLADLPEAVQVQLLEDALGEGARPVADVEAIQRAWVGGDLVTLGPLLLSDMRKDKPQLYEVLIHRRNAAWADILAKEMAGSGVEMVEVGALHMVGDEGLPELMRARGFTVERLQ